MHMTWELDRLYPSFESEKFGEEKAKCALLAQQLHDWEAPLAVPGAHHILDSAETVSALENFLLVYNEYRSLYLCLFGYAELRFSADSGDEAAMNAMDELERLQADAEQAPQKLGKWLTGLEDLEALAEQSPLILNQSFYLEELRRQSAHRLGEEAEHAISQMRSTGSKAWERLYMRTVSGLRQEMEIDGQTQSLGMAQLRSLSYDDRADVRLKAYEAEQKACESAAEVCAACINGVSGEAVHVYKLRGYASPLEKVLETSRMERGTLDAMLTAIREGLPHFRRFYRAKAKLLGHSGALPYYDAFAPLQAYSDSLLSYPEARDMIVAGFSGFSRELGDFAARAFDRRWIDAEPRPEKGGFGMCVDLFPLGESRIMTSFAGHYGDVAVLAHELGHAYHSSCLIGEPMVNTDYPVPLAETASIFCEGLIQRSLFDLAPPEATLGLMERSLSDAGYYIVDFYARYLFESRLYTRRQSGPLSVAELNALMLEALEEAYGNGIEPSSFHPYQWICRAGYFMAGNEFLNFPYSFGLLFSKGLLARYSLEAEGFPERYRTFLSSSGRADVARVAGLMQIDVNSPSFWREAMSVLVKEIEVFVNTPHSHKQTARPSRTLS